MKYLIIFLFLFYNSVSQADYENLKREEHIKKLEIMYGKKCLKEEKGSAERELCLIQNHRKNVKLKTQVKYANPEDKASLICSKKLKYKIDTAPWRECKKDIYLIELQRENVLLRKRILELAKSNENVKDEIKEVNERLYYSILILSKKIKTLQRERSSAGWDSILQHYKDQNKPCTYDRAGRPLC